MLTNHSDNCVFYLDESGDLGFGNGGSRYFVIAGVCINQCDQHYLDRYVRKFKIRNNMPSHFELKANSTNPAKKQVFCSGISTIPCSIHYVVVDKSNVISNLRKDTNILYNYLAGILLTPLACTLQSAVLKFDCRTIKVASGNSLHEHLCAKLWGEQRASVDVEFSYVDSRQSCGIQVADFSANAVFRKYERGDETCYSKLSSSLGIRRRMFFHEGT